MPSPALPVARRERAGSPVAEAPHALPERGPGLPGMSAVSSAVAEASRALPERGPGIPAFARRNVCAGRVFPA